MPKVLVAGDIDGNWDLFQSRVKSLQVSSAGPFDVLFCTGRFFTNTEEYNKVAPTLSLPLPTYIISSTGIPNEAISSLPNNLHLLGGGSQSAGMEIVQGLTVAFYSPSTSSTSAVDTSNITKFTKLSAYRGCDLFLTSVWPAEVHHFLPPALLTTLREEGGGIGGGNIEVSDLATATLPRYHFATGRGTFFQRVPYRNLWVGGSGIGMGSGVGGTTTTTSSTCKVAVTRFLGLAKVSESKDKCKKWIHALKLDPVSNMNAIDMMDEPADTTDCPYVQVGGDGGRDGSGGGSGGGGNFGSSNRFYESTASAPSMTYSGNNASAGFFFFGNRALGRDGRPVGTSAPPPPLLIAPSTSARLLFIGGVSREITENDLMKLWEGVVKVKRPEGKSYAFVEFVGHSAAKTALEGSVRRGLVLKGRTLTVGWAKEGEKGKEKEGGREGERGGDKFGVGGSLMPPFPPPFPPPNPPPLPPPLPVLSLPSDTIKTLYISGIPATAPSSSSSSSSSSASTTSNEEASNPHASVVEDESNAISVPTSSSSSSSSTTTTTSHPLHAELQGLMPQATSFHFPANKPFLFATFPSHSLAKAILEASLSQPLRLTNGSTLSVQWAKKDPRTPEDMVVEGMVLGGGGDMEGKEALHRGGRKRGRDEAGKEWQRNHLLVPPSPHVRTLFVGGLPALATSQQIEDLFQDVVGGGSDANANANPITNANGNGTGGALILNVRRPEGRDYAFVEFATPALAARAIARLVEKMDTDNKDGDECGQVVAGTADDGIGGGKDGDKLEGQNVTEGGGKDIKSARIETSDSAGRAVVGTGVSATASGRKGRCQATLLNHTVTVGWAKGAAASPPPSSHSQDCWFCMASPSIKVHLIASVGTHSYIALPRGPLSKGHVLISPIECVPSRIHLSAAAKQEVDAYEGALQKLYNEQLNATSLRFERALRTKGRDHLSLHVIPIPSSKISSCLSTFLRLVSECNGTGRDRDRVGGREGGREGGSNNSAMDEGNEGRGGGEDDDGDEDGERKDKKNDGIIKFSEIHDQRDVDEVVLTMEGGPYQEYFYVCIPVSMNTWRRFLYVQEESSSERGAGSGGGGGGGGGSKSSDHHRPNKLSLQFGQTLAAHILGCPDKARWQNNVVSEEEEGKMCEEFRNMFEPYDPLSG